MNMLIGLLILGVAIYLTWWILGMLPFPEPIKTVVTVVLAVVFLIVLLQQLGIWGGRVGGPPAWW